jgi:predicted methyltransferase
LLVLFTSTPLAIVDATAGTYGAPSAKTGDKALHAAVDGAWRSEDVKARDRYRHPVEALEFWGLRPHMTILEIQPGGGYWTEILAPYAKLTGGKFYATAADLANPKLSDASRKARTEFETRFASKPDTYGKVELVNWGAVSKTLPADTFDFILTARSIHGWMQQGPDVTLETFREFHKALKKGGILAVEQHRANPTTTEKPETGYVSEAYVIARRSRPASSSPRVPRSMRIPRTRRITRSASGHCRRRCALAEESDKPADPNFDHSKYLAIGESDRMTLKFVKP